MSPEVEAAIADVRSLGFEFARALQLIHFYAGRCPGLTSSHLFFSVTDLLLQSGLGASLLLVEGMRGSSRRECRFLLEASIKLLFADQSMPKSPLDHRLEFFKRKVSSSGFSDELDGLSFALLPEEDAEQLRTRIPRLFGHLSSFVHATHAQVEDHLDKCARGLTIGYDDLESIEDAAGDLFETFDIAVVAGMHAIGPGLAGDLMLALQDEPWVFHAGPYLSALDSYFDYKAERKPVLDALESRRSAATDAGWRAHYASTGTSR